MIKTLRLSFSLKNTYRVNSILYAIKQIPFLRRIISDNIYQIHGFKVFANVLSILWEITSVFLGKIIYFLIMIIIPLTLYKLPEEENSMVFMHIFVILTIIGAFTNSYLFNPSKDKYYAIILLGMNAREYTLVNYIYAQIKLIIGFLLCTFTFGNFVGLNWWQNILISIFPAGMKIICAAYDLNKYEQKGNVKNENKLGKILWIIIVVLLVVTYFLPILGIVLPNIVSMGIMIAGIVVGLIGLPKIIYFGHYQTMCKELLNESNIVQVDKNAQVKLQQMQVNKVISNDNSVISSKKGFAYLNDLFIKRHKKILWKSAEKITAIAFILIIVCCIAVMYFEEVKMGINNFLLNALPYFVFVMYFINRGTGFTQALFVNCDHSLLTYPFYKKPQNILELFRIRLWEIIKINLLPAFAIASGLVLLLFLSGGTDNNINYILVYFTIIALSIFFSIHYLMLYYLVQPYNAATEVKSGTYQLVISFTYFICYMMIELKLPTLYFGICTILFCILYSIVASILVYKLAPKTFCIRQ